MIKDKIRQFAASDSFFDEFRRNGEIEKFLREKHSENTKLVGLMSIGTSIEHRDIMAVKIGVDHGRANKSIIYIDGGTHAREWAAVSTACYIIDRLIDDYNAGDKVVTYLLNRFDFYVVPVVNPDGYEYSHTTDRMWRKNKAILKGTDCLGTDLNRNYGFHWGGEGSSRDPCEENYSGPKPFSEPESRAVSSLIVDNKHRLMAYITLHSYGQWFLYPWGWTEADSPNKKELKRVADIGHTALNSVYGTTYKLGSPGQIMYWAHGFAHIPYVYCLEMRDEGQHGFLLPAKDIIPVGNETYAAVKAMAREIALTRRVKSNVKLKCIDSLGTDLNRNYGFHWGGEGSSRDPCEENYLGLKTQCSALINSMAPDR
ncbi:unnamed protein product [Medioppia subpectinata]|uniref:Peptidase M14 domain-containing protein n=1 Tax=Medioppia subpectinata TaxID=1979941 RepID=A0A7R9KPU2_9ACAR|nr:unnamed protein product [Medioppia subpectinata]CAG2107277.1 unnamed protein product [Medioppia subpectinata]